MKPPPTNTLAEALATELPDEQIAIAIRDALTATQTTRSGTVEPDHKTRLQAATLALAYKHGRPVERQEVITANLSENDSAILERVKNSPTARAALRRMLDSAENGQKGLPYFTSCVRPDLSSRQYNFNLIQSHRYVLGSTYLAVDESTAPQWAKNGVEAARKQAG